MDFMAAVKKEAPSPPAVFKPPQLPAIEGFKGYLSVAYGARFEKIILAFEAIRKTGVDSEESSKDAVTITGLAKKLFKEMEDERKKISGPINSFVSKLNGAFKLYQETLKGVETDTKRFIQIYQNRVELERRKAEEAARKEAEALQEKLNAEAAEAGVEAPEVVPAVVAPKPTVTRTEDGTAYEVVTWDFTVEDETKIPREYLMVDTARIRQAVKAGLREIPGIKIFEKKEVRVRT